MYDTANVQKIVEPLKETEAESESNRRLSARAVDLLHQSGATRIVAPAAYGGYELPVRVLVEAERAIAHGSTAASWVLMVCAAHTFIAGRMERRGQDEIFGGHPGMLIPGVPSLRGTCQRTKGGYILNGRWPYASGADHGDWVLVGCKGIRSEADEPCPALIVVMPKKHAVIDDTWFTLGMRGTGSKDVVLENTFIPEHYAVPMIEAQMGTVPGVDSPLYRLPIRPTLATMLLGTIVGMAERGLQLFIDQTRTRRDVYTGTMKVDSPGIQRRVAEAGIEVNCAWSLTQQNCDLLEHAMRHDPPMPTATRAQIRWNAAYATELCRRATNRLFEGAGAGAAHDSHLMQIFFRDMNTATHHAMLDFDTNVEIQGKVILGVELNDAWV
ncbi:MAG: acyl-CoA dehydrogenase family protein [Alphaproteobacteria bacterium]|nr:acyl-CoA dehydrogenase family protein [Alphaproteobacteria bacterium]